MRSNYDKNPGVRVDDISIWCGWNNILEEIASLQSGILNSKKVLAIECYAGVHENEISENLKKLNPSAIISSTQAYKEEPEIYSMTQKYVTNDRIFGFMTSLTMADFIDPEKQMLVRNQIDKIETGLVVIIGSGASLVYPESDLLIYVDMARWEIQKRMKANQVHGIAVDDHELEFSYQYKRGYFVDWRVCDKLKQELYSKMDYILDTNTPLSPKMVKGIDFQNALSQIVNQPFRVVPYFDPGPWGGQWMKEVCDLDKNKENFAWCFDCVPEENSLKIFVGDAEFETPSINLVFTNASQLLGKQVEARFGKEFPIRFDFLDTMDGGNLSFQVHPTTQYMKETFGMNYTQDESYYLLDTEEDATVYLGLKDGIVPDDMIRSLKNANEGNSEFPVEEYVNVWPAKKHDHFLIPAGTVHCSGKNSMVLEISSTPYIFTFKMWDWNRLGMDGKPRPINIAHAEKVIDWNRTTEFTRNELVNQAEVIDEGDGWREEKTGLHNTEFIETRRHWFTKPVHHHTNGSVNVINLVEGREALVTSPEDSFKPFVVHYAETFIIPEAVKEYIISPHGESTGQEIATLKANIRI